MSRSWEFPLKDLAFGSSSRQHVNFEAGTGNEKLIAKLDNYITIIRMLYLSLACQNFV